MHVARSKQKMYIFNENDFKQLFDYTSNNNFAKNMKYILKIICTVTHCFSILHERKTERELYLPKSFLVRLLITCSYNIVTCYLITNSYEFRNGMRGLNLGKKKIYHAKNGLFLYQKEYT